MGIGIETRAVSPPQPRVDVETAYNGGYGKVRVKDGAVASRRAARPPPLARGGWARGPPRCPYCDKATAAWPPPVMTRRAYRSFLFLPVATPNTASTPP